MRIFFSLCTFQTGAGHSRPFLNPDIFRACLKTNKQMYINALTANQEFSDARISEHLVQKGMQIIKIIFL
jgi:hypothetical protein